MKHIVIDGSNATLGRLASYAAKQALLGRKVSIVNCKLVVVTGRPRMIIKEYKHIRAKGGASLRGPFFPKIPSRLVKRTIRGMMAYKQGRGSDAYDRILCYDSVPEELKEVKKISAGKPKHGMIMSLEELQKEI